MGSLMAGWQTNPEDAKKALKRSTSSVTREEVERFWRARKELMEKQLTEAQRDADHARTILVVGSPVSDLGCASSSSHYGSIFGSPPITPTTPPTSAEQYSASPKSPGWWQKSYWAFLNEPPIMEDRQNRYVAQFDLRPLKAEWETPKNIHMRHTRSDVT